MEFLFRSHDGDDDDDDGDDDDDDDDDDDSDDDDDDGDDDDDAGLYSTSTVHATCPAHFRHAVVMGQDC